MTWSGCIYSSERMRASGKQEVMESLLVRNLSRFRMNDRIKVKESQGKVLQLCHSCGRVKIDKTRITEEGIQVEGIVILKLLYIIGNDEMPFYSMEAMLPFTHVIDAKGVGGLQVFSAFGAGAAFCDYG